MVHRIAIEVTARALTVRVELTPEPRPVVETDGHTLSETTRPLAKHRPSAQLRKVGT